MIGVFDSGYGGLTILRELMKKFPEYSFMYLGDNANAPFGNKREEDVIENTRRGVEELYKRGCVLVILACNTASAVALRDLQQNWLAAAWPDRKLLGIVVPTIEQITEATSPMSVGVLATQRTVTSRAYEHEIHKRNPSISITQYACGNLARTIESFGTKSTEVVQEAKQCVEGLLEKGKVDAVLLGCTHYELIADTIAGFLPPGITLFHQPSIVAKSLQDYLLRHDEIDSRIKKTGERIYFTSGDPEVVSNNSEIYMGEKATFQSIS